MSRSPAERRAQRPGTAGRRRVMVVGSGTRFLSGISIYTVRLANALSARGAVSIVTMRQLLPTRLYPGHRRVGEDLAALDPDPAVRMFDGIDWFWGPGIVRAIAFMAHRRPDVVIMQWWTGTVLHTYLLLAIVARMMGSRVIIEFHEVLDTGELRIAAARAYVAVVAPLVLRMASAFAVHSEFDADLLRSRYDLRGRPIVTLPHGPHDHYRSTGVDAPLEPLRDAPAEVTNILFFGIIRPYKGLEDLVAAFDLLEEDEVAGYWLTVVGETWEGWTEPARMIAESRYRDRITFVNRYVHDRELDAYLRGADVVALPYRRSSLSGPLHVAMGYGLPVVIAGVGGNVEAAAGYGGAVFASPEDPTDLRRALRQAGELRGQRYPHPISWNDTAAAYESLFAELLGDMPRPAGPA